MVRFLRQRVVPASAVNFAYPMQAARAFGSKSNGPVNLESRILRNPILATEEPPFELPWLLKHGKVCACCVCVCRLFKEEPAFSFLSDAKSSQTAVVVVFRFR